MLFQVSPTTFQVSSTCFQGVFLSCTCFFHQLFQQVFLMFHLFPAFSSHFPVWKGHIFPGPGWSRCRCRSDPPPRRWTSRCSAPRWRPPGWARCWRRRRWSRRCWWRDSPSTPSAAWEPLDVGSIGVVIYVMSRIWGELWFSCGYGMW